MPVEQFLLGKLYRARGTFRDADEALADPTTVTLHVRPGPVAAWETYTLADAEVTRESLGVFFRDLTLDTPGMWAWRWESTGNPTTADQGVFDVVDTLVTA